MDYWGMPLARTNLEPYTFGINLSHRIAVIPGDGNDVICMTYTYDMAKYVVNLLDLDEWPEFSVFVGDQVTYNQLLEMAEEIRGKRALYKPHVFSCLCTKDTSFQAKNFNAPITRSIRLPRAMSLFPLCLQAPKFHRMICKKSQLWSVGLL